MGLFDFLKPVAEKTVAVSPVGIAGNAIKGETPEMFTGDFYTSSDTKGNPLSDPFTAPFKGELPFQTQLKINLLCQKYQTQPKTPLI